MDFIDFYSHKKPDILLKDHLQYVGNRSRKIILSKKFNGLNKDTLSDVAYFIGISHDFGKYTTFFQEKLKGFRDKNDPLTYHGLISALFAFEVVNEYIKVDSRNLDLENKSPYKFLPLLAYFVVKRHHLNLDDIEQDVDAKKLFDAGFKYISTQLEDIKNNIDKIKEEYASLFDRTPLSKSFEGIFDNLNERYGKKVEHSEEIEDLIGEIDKSLYFLEKEPKDIIYYLLVQLLYSVLIDSDKKHAGHVRGIERKELPDDLVERYLKMPEFKAENKSNINDMREEIRKSVLKNIREPENINQKIFTITAPTGTGKTLTALSAALVLRKRLKDEIGLRYEPRIIYSLPFTSIIDQNFEVFDKVLMQLEDFREHESEYLLKHHYLSDIFYKTENMEEEKDVDESLALIEAWESEIIVTTFIQLFYTLIGYRNKTLKKFHNIVNSIIILDEVQNIPIKYWKVVETVLTGMGDYFGCRVILMTATKPLIFEDGHYKELVDGHEKYFKMSELSRVRLIIDSEKRQIDEINIEDWSKNSYLFVFNTIQSSLDFYDKVCALIVNSGMSYKICYLSTNIIPKERRKRIDAIKKSIRNKEKVVVVSTQLIEAGVDIDCDIAYRDFGPLDSIIQVAGRCNRNKANKQGKMHLLNLINSSGKSYTSIYDPTLMKIVKNLLEDKLEIKESEFLSLINDYFIAAKKEQIEETALIDSIYDLYYDSSYYTDKRTPISSFKLIEESYKKVDVFVEYDEKAEKVWREYCDIIKLKSLERKREFLKIKRDFYNYVISIDEKKAEGLEKIGSLGYLPRNQLKIYYDLDTGFKRNNEAYLI